jgi:circadian clock protein KaiC
LNEDLVSTGIEGLDDILRGGLTPNRFYLIEGDPGSGKTTIALQFLLAGVARGERCLFVSLSETEEELRASARSHGWSLDGIEILEVIPSEAALKQDARYTIYHPSEVELSATIGRVLEHAQRLSPSRLIIDSLAELRLLAEDALRYRRQVMALKQFFSRRDCTVICTDDRTGERRDMSLHSFAHGVLNLEHHTPDYGVMRRRMHIAKLRGREFRQGHQDYQIVRGGIEVYPRLVAAEHASDYPREPVESGVAELDALLGGGLARGTSTLLLGPAGSGKSTIASQYAVHSANAGDRAAMFLFDENVETFRERNESLGLDLQPALDAGRLQIRQVDPAELSPGEFAHAVQRVVEKQDAKIVVIDSLNGYLHAMPSEEYLTLHLHEMLSYLGRRGVTSLLIMAQHGFAGTAMQVPVDTSYLADTVLLLRYFEAAGAVRQAVSVMKKRTGRHERTIRELSIGGNGLQIGEPIRDFQGVLTGAPTLITPLPDFVRRQ